MSNGQRAKQQEVFAWDGQWCSEEFAAINFGDARLNRRFIRTAQMLAQQPTNTINQACPNWADTKGAYRLFDNDRVSANQIRAAHLEKTLSRIRGLPRILVVQDTSFFNFNSHEQTEGLGPIGKRAQSRNPSQGLLMHSALALQPSSAPIDISESIKNDAIPLGILDQKIWARAQEKVTRKCTGTPIEHKESYKWFESLQATIENVSPATEVVTICDREGDIYEFLYYAQQHNAKYLVRSNRDRRLAPEQRWDPKKDGRYGVKPGNTLRAHMAEQPVVSEFNLELASRKGAYPERTATVEIRISQTSFQPPTWPAKLTAITPKMGPVRAYVIWVKEKNPPQDLVEFAALSSKERRDLQRAEGSAGPIDWMLVTNVEIKGVEDALERVYWYQQRWQIECYHKVIKSGCGVEKCRLQNAKRLEKYITLCSIIAWRLYWMVRINRKNPHQPCTALLAEHEWKALYCKIHRTQVPADTPPTIRQAVRWMAQLGGFLGRKNDGEPGITTVWRGWQRLHDVSDDWLLFSSA